MRPQSKQTSRTRRLTLAGLAAMTLGTSAMPVAAAEPAPATSLRLPTLAPADQPASPQAVNRPVPMPPVTTPQASGDGEPTWSTEPPAWLSPTPSSAWNPPTSQWKSQESEQKPLGLEWRPPASESSTPASEWTPTNLTWQPENEDSVPVDEVIGALGSEGTPTDTKTVPLNEYQELLDRLTPMVEAGIDRTGRKGREGG